MAALNPTTWDIAALGENLAWQRPGYWINERAKHRRYSFRMLRYWYMERLLDAEAKSLGRPLRVLEVGVDRGQMKEFVDGATKAAAPYSVWDAADALPQHAMLKAAGYANCRTVDLDNAESLAALATSCAGQYDVVIALHVLEHLKGPERAVQFLNRSLVPGGIMIGGFPVLPSGIAALREKQLRKKAKPYGHITAFSPARVRAMATGAGMTPDHLWGAFAVRASGLALEDKAWWMRANVRFGALFPWWPGEVYWQFRGTR